ncbi:hypothetical protein XH98_23545 [Bradyrhizobium sp. CCBAU 51745]|nr:hypothetical protein [Bradyrhizobium sp. CCBAU 45384]MDA9442008.1 hypothetical protein [Bradyrhizobium sp. CCBAU 51745]
MGIPDGEAGLVEEAWTSVSHCRVARQGLASCQHAETLFRFITAILGDNFRYFLRRRAASSERFRKPPASKRA